MPQKKKTPFEKYTSAQKSIDALLAKYDGSREKIFILRQMYESSKDPKLRQHDNDYRNLHRHEKIIKEYEDSVVGRPQDPPPAPAPRHQDLPCFHSSFNHRHTNDVSILF